VPKGPKGEYRPADPIKSAMLMMRIATGDITEEEARKIALKPRRVGKSPVKRAK
jgi:hypothetical protein